MEKMNNFWKGYIIGVVVVLVATFVFLSGCEETQKTKQIATTTDPFSVILKPNKQWVDKFGNSKESNLVYNIVVLDRTNSQQHQAITKTMLDPNDPNSIENILRKLEDRIDLLEVRCPVIEVKYPSTEEYLKGK